MPKTIISTLLRGIEIHIIAGNICLLIYLVKNVLIIFELFVFINMLLLQKVIHISFLLRLLWLQRA